ncbi:MAG: hypothetical protein AAFR97_05015, partial [Bacteroidota bacterium]
LGAGDEDEYQAVLPFDFTYYGTTYTVGTNFIARPEEGSCAADVYIISNTYAGVLHILGRQSAEPEQSESQR